MKKLVCIFEEVYYSLYFFFLPFFLLVQTNLRLSTPILDCSSSSSSHKLLIDFGYLIAT